MYKTGKQLVAILLIVIVITPITTLLGAKNSNLLKQDTIKQESISQNSEISEISDNSIIVKAGTLFPIKIQSTLQSGATQVGAKFSGVVGIDIILDSGDIIPEGLKVQGEVIESVKGGRLKGVPSITVRITHIKRGDKYFPFKSVPLKIAGESNGKKTIVKTGVGAAVGAAFNGGTGAGRGAAVMGGVHLLSNNGNISIPKGYEISFTLESDTEL